MTPEWKIFLQQVVAAPPEEYRRCNYCNELFLLPTRHSTKVYCNEEHQKLFHTAKRAERRAAARLLPQAVQDTTGCGRVHIPSLREMYASQTNHEGETA